VRSKNWRPLPSIEEKRVQVFQRKKRAANRDQEWEGVGQATEGRKACFLGRTRKKGEFERSIPATSGKMKGVAAGVMRAMLIREEVKGRKGPVPAERKDPSTARRKKAKKKDLLSSTKKKREALRARREK